MSQFTHNHAMYQELDWKDAIIARLSQGLRELDAELVRNTEDITYWQQRDIRAEEHGPDNYTWDNDEYYDNRPKRRRTSPLPRFYWIRPLTRR